MPWTCQQTEDRLLEGLEATLEGPERRQFEEHLATCPKCRALAAEVRQIVTALGQLERVEPAPHLLARIIAQTSGTKPARSWRQVGWLDLIVQPRFGLGVAVVLISFTILLHALSSGLPASLAALNPFELYQQADRRVHLVYARGVKFLSDLRVVYEIQSRFESPSTTAPSSTPEKKSTDQLQRLYYNRLESHLGSIRTRLLGETHEMRRPSRS